MLRRYFSQTYLLLSIYFVFSLKAVHTLKRPISTRIANSLASATGSSVKSQLPVETGSSFQPKQSGEAKESSRFLDTLQSENVIENAKANIKSVSLKKGSLRQNFKKKGAKSNGTMTHAITTKIGVKAKVSQPALMPETGSSAVKTTPSVQMRDEGDIFKGSDDFKVKFLSLSQAYLQSPGWGNGENYPPGLNIWERLEIPSGKELRIAVQHLSLLNHTTTTTTNNNNDNSNNNQACDSASLDTLSVFTVTNSSRTLLWTACGSQKPLPVIRTARAVAFHFTTKNKTYNSGAYAVGFKLWLTFFLVKNKNSEKEDLERQLPLNWPWPDFKKSKPPEAYCKGEGLFWVEGMCLRILQGATTTSKPQKRSWTMAAELCRQENATLPSLKTPREWQALVDFLTGRDFRKKKGGALETVYVGLRFANDSPPGYKQVPLYKGLGVWADGSTAFFLRHVRQAGKTCTAFLKGQPGQLVGVDCDTPHHAHILCQIRPDYDVTTATTTTTSTNSITFSNATANMAVKLTVSTQSGAPSSSVPGADKKSEAKTSGLVRCPGTGHYVQAHLACAEDCYGERLSVESRTRADWHRVFQDPVPSRRQCPVPLPPPLPPSFTCQTGSERVPFAWVCDGVGDCGDASDEDFCQFPHCRPQQLACRDGWQCTDTRKQCDGNTDCSDGSDEAPSLCNTLDTHVLSPPALLSTLPPPVLIDTNRHGHLTLKAVDDRHMQAHARNIFAMNEMIADGCEDFFTCPRDTHFRCSLFCMPVYLRCNGVKDCPGGEDEAWCERYECPGYYRCRASSVSAGKVCVHVSNVCDGVSQCPLQDDEAQCGVPPSCPHACSCRYLHAFTCWGPFAGKRYPGLRYLHARESGMRLGDVQENRALVYLNLASCDIRSADELGAVLVNLRTLDLSANRIRSFGRGVLSRLPALVDLSLRGNPLVLPFSGDQHRTLPALQRLDLSLVWIFEIDGQDLSKLDLRSLHVLNLSYTGLERVVGSGFRSLSSLRVLDLRGCPVDDFTEDTFSQLLQLRELYGSNPKLCCPANLPDSVDFDLCSVPKDSAASCDSLLYSKFYRLLLILFASLALGGNVGSLLYRLFLNRDEKEHSCGVMVTHLSVSDFLMGVYLVIIGVTDTRYGSTYFIHSGQWKGSKGCKAAGFLSLLSCEASAFFICLLTLDRLAALRFPDSRFHFRKNSAQLVCWMTWFAALFIAAVPLIESHWKFYGEVDTCLPLPTNAKSFDGRDYSFGVLVMLNFVLFLVIAAGQALIFCAVKSKRKTLGVNRELQSLERAITTRLVAIALTDFACWFPVCLVGFLASDGLAMPGHMDTALSVVVLPLNSALNPFIYTFSMIREKRRHRQRDFLESETTFML